MTSIAASATRSGLTLSQRVKRLTPTGPDLVDATLLTSSLMVALLGFRTTFDSPRYLAVGAVGILLGLMVAHLANVLRQPWITVMGMAVAAFFLAGGATALREGTIAGLIPSVDTLKGLAAVSVDGWKQMLTTLPPVDGDGQLVVLPYLLALLASASGFALARRSRQVMAPLIAPALLMAAVILLGTIEPAAATLQGIGLALLVIVWGVVRHRRTVSLVGTGRPSRTQAMLATGLVALSLSASYLIAGSLPGSERERIVLRTYVQPPFDVTAYPSPLAGFRKYTEGAKQLWDQELVTVSGAPAGTLMRFAVLDDFNGTVWSAGSPAPVSGFQRVGSVIPNVRRGDEVTATLTIGAAYAAVSDVNVWLPAPGAASRVEFAGPQARSHEATFRYNLGTSQGVLPDRLKVGDVVTVTSTPLPTYTVGNPFGPSTSTTLDPTAYTFVAGPTTKWIGKEGALADQVAAIAKAMRSGAYSDGTRTGETHYLPGHGTGRLTKFVASPQIVGNDEQYAATFALAMAQLGIPARVVFGAPVPTDLIIRGKDVHAWVEINTSEAGWQVVPFAAFTPDRTKRPTVLPPDTVTEVNAAVVPPPNAVKPPGSIEALADSDPSASRPPTKSANGFVIPEIVILIAKIVGIPLLMMAVFAAVVLALKGRRRRLRRTRGPADQRVASAWRELVDTATDLGVTPRPGQTRRETARELDRFHVRELADRVDAGVFGADQPTDAEVTALWGDVDRHRRTMARATKRFGRLRSALNPKSLLRRPGRIDFVSVAQRIPAPKIPRLSGGRA